MELLGKIIDVMEAITVSGTTTFVPTMLCGSNSQHQCSRRLTCYPLMLVMSRSRRLWRQKESMLHSINLKTNEHTIRKTTIPLH